MTIAEPGKPVSPLPPSVDPMRQRLAEAILKATMPQQGQGPMQALGGAKMQPQGPARSTPAPGPAIIQPRGGPGPGYYSQAKKPLPMPGGQRPIRPMQRPQRRPPIPGG